MSAEILSFETGRPAEIGSDEPSLMVDVEGYEGPLDLLLALAKVNGAIGAYEREHALLDRAAADLDRLDAPSDERALRVRVLRAPRAA